MGRPRRLRLGGAGLRSVKAALLILAALGTAPLAAQPRAGAAAWGIEAVGGTLGSLAGFGAGILLAEDQDCEDDLQCELTQAGVAVGLATMGATLGNWAIGRAADTGPSFAGAAVGSLVGAAAGIGVVKLLDEMDSSSSPSQGAIVVGFSVTQGVLTALGSRIGAALR